MRLRLSLFGPFEAWLDGEALRLTSRCGQALLAMLPLAPKSALARDLLAATLRPDRAQDQACASLRQELSTLRRALHGAGDILTADAAMVRLCPEALDPDLGQSGQGEFLEGLDLRSEPFDDWRRA